VSPVRRRLDWTTAAGTVSAVEPSPAEIAAHAGELAAAYNEPHNHAMLANTMRFEPDDVVENYEEMIAAGGRVFLFYEDGLLAGDGDVRNIEDRGAELALLVASRAAQGKGLGTRFATLLHVFAFRELALERVYVTILPKNVGSRRVFEKLGHRVDVGARARSYVDDQADVSLSLGRDDFLRTHPDAMAEVRVRDA
jgi:RimJ/RimL family protein N-acetyltransferase